MKALFALLFVSLAPAEELSADRIAAAMRTALAENVQIDVVDHSRSAACAGTLMFKRAALLPVLDADPKRVVYWRGDVQCADGRTSPIWARARLTVKRALVVAKEPVAAGTELQPEQLELREVECAMTGPRTLEEVNAAAGTIAMRPIAKGQPIRREWLKVRPQVARGQQVLVRVVAGRAQLLLQGRAESSGSTGQQVMVKNPASGKMFRATVEGMNAVWVKGS